MPDPVSGVIAGSAIIGAGASIFGGNKAADEQKKASKKAAKLQKQALAQQLALTKPYVEAGTNALAEYQKMAPYKDFGMAEFQADPGYNFRMAEGMKALERSAAARGLLQSGGTLKGIQQYGQNLASSEYENAFSRYLTQREARMDPYRYLSGQGQAAAVGQAANVGSSGAALAELAAQRGNANAALAAGTGSAIGNAFTSAGQGIGSYYANQPYMNYLQSITPSTGSSLGYAPPAGYVQPTL
jgi:hypothetical protein